MAQWLVAEAGTVGLLFVQLLLTLVLTVPLLLIFGGVIGGLLAFGLVGVFGGPAILAVAYTLLDAWIDERLDPWRQASTAANRRH